MIRHLASFSPRFSLRPAWRSWGGVVFLSIFGGSLCAAPKKQESVHDPIRTYQFKYETDAAYEAVRGYLSFLQKVAPGLEGIGAQYTVADLFMDQGHFEDAARLLKNLSEVPTQDEYFRASVMMRLAACYMRRGLYSQAAPYFAAVTEGKAKALVPEAIIGLALATLSVGDIEKAYQHFREISALYPAYKTHPRYMLSLGLIQWEVRKYQGALDYLLRDDRNPASRYFSGLCYRELKMFPEASGAFRKITQEFPDSVWADRARFELGETFYLQGDYLLASQTFGDIFRSHRTKQWDHLSLYRLACCDVRMKKYSAAEERLWTLNESKLDPALAANVNYLLTESLATQDKISKIVGILEQVPARKRTPENNYRIIWARAAQGDFQKTTKQANEFLNEREDPELTPRTLLLQGYAFERLGQKPESFASYQLVAEHFSGTPYAAKAAELACMSFFRAGEFKSMTTQVNSLWRLVDPEIQKKYPETIYWMGHAAMKLRDYPQAQKQFKEFLSVASVDHPWVAEALRSQALAFAMDKSVKEALPILQRAYQSAEERGQKKLMGKLTLDMANISFNARRFEDAISNYRRLGKIDPQNEQMPFALFQEALSLYRSEYYNEAISTWERLSLQYPRDPRAAESLFRASRTLFEMGKYTEAIVGYQSLVRNFPDSPFVRDCRFQIGQCYFNSKDWPNAIKVYNDFQTRFPDDPERAQVDNYIQLASYNSGMTADQLTELFKGKTKSPVLADIYWTEGAKQYNEKNYAAARENFQKILYEFPSSSWAAQASFYRAETLFFEEKYLEAVGAYDGFLQGFPDNANVPPARFHLGVSYFSLNNFERSAAVFDQYSKDFPTDPLARNAALNTAISYSRIGDVDKTNQAYINYAAAYPDADDLGAAFIQLGQFLEKVGQESRAIEAYKRVPEKRPEYAQSLYLLARLYKNLSEPAGEKLAYESLRAVPAKGDLYRIAGILALADLFVAANDAPKALAAYEDVKKNATDEASRSLAQQQISAIRAILDAPRATPVPEKTNAPQGTSSKTK
jgi:TolA-binding protein